MQALLQKGGLESWVYDAWPVFNTAWATLRLEKGSRLEVQAARLDSPESLHGNRPKECTAWESQLKEGASRLVERGFYTSFQERCTGLSRLSSNLESVLNHPGKLHAARTWQQTICMASSRRDSGLNEGFRRSNRDQRHATLTAEEYEASPVTLTELEGELGGRDVAVLFHVDDLRPNLLSEPGDIFAESDLVMPMEE